MKINIKNIFRKILLRILQDDQPTPFYTKDCLMGRGFEIGEFTYGHPKVLHWGENATLKIGKFCSIADDVTIFLGGNHRVDWVTTYPFNILNRDFPNATSIKGHPSTKGNVIIGNDVWIGQNATILSGVTIESGAVIAAHSVVTKNVGAYEIVGGNPAQLIRARFSKEVVELLLEIKWWDWKPEVINNVVHKLCSNELDDFLKDYYK